MFKDTDLNGLINVKWVVKEREKTLTLSPERGQTLTLSPERGDSES